VAGLAAEARFELSSLAIVMPGKKAGHDERKNEGRERSRPFFHDTFVRSLASASCRSVFQRMDTGSRLENASNKEIEPAFRFDRNAKGSSAVPQLCGLLGAAIEVWGLRRVHSNGHIAELLFTFGLAPAVRQERLEV
jgi:hypothetical protein